MIIRRGQHYDIPGVMKLIDDFQDEGLDEYSLGHDKESALMTVKLFEANHLHVVAIEDDEVIGVLGGFLVPYFLKTKSVAFQEILWYVRMDKRDGGAGMKLFYAMQKLAKENGANHMVMAHTGKVVPEKLAAIYDKLGFEVLETQYIREIK